MLDHGLTAGSWGGKIRFLQSKWPGRFATLEGGKSYEFVLLGGGQVMSLRHWEGASDFPIGTYPYCHRLTRANLLNVPFALQRLPYNCLVLKMLSFHYPRVR